MAGKADTSRHVRAFRGTQVHIRRDHPAPAHCDGDPFRAGVGMSFEIDPGALDVVVPPARKERI